MRDSLHLGPLSEASNVLFFLFQIQFLKMIFELEDDCFLLLRAQELFVFIFSVCLLLVMIRPSCECEKNPVKNRPCLPFRLQIAQLHQTSREP